MQFQRIESRKVDKATGLRCDQIIRLSGFNTRKCYPDKLRRVKYHDNQTDKILVFLTNNFDIPALTVAELYRNRWRVELFFKWIKQHLKIKAFFGTSANAVKTQIWIAICIYVMVAIIRKMEKIELNLYTILQIFSVSLFEKVSIYQLLTDDSLQTFDCDSRKQLNLFEL